MGAVPSPFVVLAPGARAACPHGGQMLTVIAEARVVTSGQILVTSIVPVAIAGCSFTVPPGTPHPCTLVSGAQLSKRVFVNGKPALLAPRPMLCQAVDQVPQGAPLFLQPAARVVGT